MDLRNSIMEEVILKNYKLLQYVENEMNQIKNEIKLVKEENAHLKKEMNQIKDDNIKLIEENKINKNLFCADIKDTVENTMIIGYDYLYKPILFNIENAYLLPIFNKSTDLRDALGYGMKYIMSVKVFTHLNKFNNFKTFTINNVIGHRLIDEKFNEILLYAPDDVTSPCIINGYLNMCGEVKGEYIKLAGKFYHKQNIKKLLNILDECNIKLIIEYIGCDEYRRDNLIEGTMRDLLLL
jgi:hypothetical protein